jgi:hypothetical protein
VHGRGEATVAPKVYMAVVGRRRAWVSKVGKVGDGMVEVGP